MFASVQLLHRLAEVALTTMMEAAPNALQWLILVMSISSGMLDYPLFA